MLSCVIYVSYSKEYILKMILHFFLNNFNVNVQHYNKFSKKIFPI
jgi:hypothetical protein